MPKITHITRLKDNELLDIRTAEIADQMARELGITERITLYRGHLIEPTYAILALDDPDK